MRHSRQFDITSLAACAPRQDYAEDLTRNNGIFTESLIEITHPVEEQRVRILRLDLIKLL